MVSLRRTLSVRFSITMFVALLVIALWAFLGAQRVLRDELDRGLAAAAHLEAAVVLSGLSIPAQSGFAERDAFVAAVNRFVVVRDADAAVLASNTPLGADLPNEPGAFARAMDGEASWATIKWNGEAIRTYLLPLDSRGERDARVIQVAALLGPMHAVSRTVLFLMLGTVLLGMVATMFGAGWLARAAVEPVSEIAAQAESVRPGEVNQRITAHAGVSEFNGLVRVLNQMLERLDRGVLAQRRIIADVSHDLRTPITAMLGELEVALRRRRSPDQYQAILQSLLEEVNHLSSINETLVTLARIEAGELAPERVPTDVDGLLRRAAERIRPRAGKRTISIHARMNGDDEITIDQHLIGLVLDQLLDNAVRHTPDAANIQVRAAPSDDALAVTVEDDGDGVPNDALPHLFERFYRGDAARGRSAGAGLGLTVVAAIIAAHGGVIRAAASDTGGLLITFSLPRQAGTAS